MNDEEQIIDLTGSANEAVEALWQLLDRLQEIADRLDPLAEELAQVPEESNLLLKKLFEYLASLQELSTDTATRVESIQETIASIRSDQSAQAERMERMETMLREIHVPLTAHIR
jgi:thioesterase domain-containing protein